ncbi:beta-ketoacyl synthase [Frankia sp. AgB32]|uniref:beta-ketoacyl synthase n=1 Tax=Frankia sp. AgB32 TaxID=631119 RepID=UPI00200CA2CE|nr:beta-ketoacyl synthase [Frankia sp. AgB32]MCK9895062.1 beta-ketoacyl synthase [Frankia sp. AgB32]
MSAPEPPRDAPEDIDSGVIIVEVDELAWSEQVVTDTHEALAGGATRGGPADVGALPPAIVPAASPRRSGGDVRGLAELADQLHRSVSDAHGNALAAQQALQLVLVRQWAKQAANRPGSATKAGLVNGAVAAVGPVGAQVPAAPQGSEGGAWRCYEIRGDRLVERADPPTLPCPRPSQRSSPKPLARSARTALAEQDLVALTRGEIAAVFGAAYAQPGLNRRVRLAAGRPLELGAVDRLHHRGGAAGHGLLTARLRVAATQRSPAGRHLAVARQAAEVLALYLGLHLCFADCELAVGLPADAVTGGDQVPVLSLAEDLDTQVIRVEVTALELVPLPWLAADVTFHDARNSTTGRINGLALHARPRSGAPLGPVAGGTVPEFLGRFNSRGDRALLSEFNIAHISDGDQAIAMGPEFARFSTVPAVRLPSADLLLVDRVMDLTGRRGDLHQGARWRTEYDSPADAWYYRDTANAGMPNCVHMESSLQAAAFIGPYLGGTLLGGGAEPLRLRNLEGQATLLREVDLRDQTISQESSVISTSVTPGALLQEFAYECSLADNPFYRGTSLFGYFSSEALNNQVGLDGGRLVPTWLDLNGTATTRTVDVSARRAAPGRMPCSVDRLALVEEFDVVDGGGNAGLGYLHWVQPVDPTAWYFEQHFRLDPVIPGSFGVETLVQAVQEWALDTGLDRDLDRPEFVVPAGATLRWKYRGQFLRADTPMTFEVHIAGVERRPGRVRVTAEGNVWKPGMRIYRIDQLCVELRTAGAPAW